MGNNAALCWYLRFRWLLSCNGSWGGERLHFGTQVLRVPRIEASRNGWLANGGGHGDRAFACRSSIFSGYGSLAEFYACCKARNTAAIFSRERASARTSMRTPAVFKAARTALSSWRPFKLFTNVLRFCAKANFNNSRKGPASICRSDIRGSMVSRSTLECTLGAGSKAPGGRVNRFSTRANNCAVADSNP